MAKVAPLQNNFGAGELSPLVYGRLEADRYKAGLAVCKNYLPTVQGGLVRRPGSKYVAAARYSDKTAVLIPFQFSTTQAYILEFGDLYIRFYKDNAQILSGTPVTVTTPYLEADLAELSFTQSADVLYLTHPSYKPRKLTRTSHTSWTLSEISFRDGPYLSSNFDDSTTLRSSDTITFGAVSGATGFTFSLGGMTIEWVGRLFRFKDSAGNWSWGRMTGYTNGVSGTMTILGPNLASTTACTEWRLGLWWGVDTDGYFPACASFFEDRLFFGGANNYPQRYDGSNSGDYENFSPSDADGVIVASNALSFSDNANEVCAIFWMSPDEKGLLHGTFGSEWVVRPSQQQEALTPTNVISKEATSHGCAQVRPIRAGKATLFVQKSGRKLRELSYFYDVDGFRASDLSQIAEHITLGGLERLAYQKEPQPVVWAVRGDGVLLSMTYERDADNLKVGWARHILGGTSDAAGTHAEVESVAVIPSADDTTQDVWVLVKRYINGSVVRYVEYLTKLFDDSMELKDAFFVDSGLTYDAPKTITGITAANPPVVTSAAHGFSNGDRILISDVVGMTELNTNTYKAASVAANTFQLTDEDGNNIDASAYTAYISGGYARKYVTSISGLSHLEGETVSILADGAVQVDAEVTSGAITLAHRATTVQIGLGYQSDGQMLRLDAGAANGTSLGKTRRGNLVGFLLHRTVGFKFGMNFDELNEIVFRTAADPVSRAVPLFSGIKLENSGADYDPENQFCWRQDTPLPGTILAVVTDMTTQDRG